MLQNVSLAPLCQLEVIYKSHAWYIRIDCIAQAINYATATYTQQLMESGHSPFPWPQSRNAHIIVLIPATISFLATVLGSYWFIGMLRAQRNFRRTLVFMLILADCAKSFWIMIFSIVGLVTSSSISSRSAFCQAGGFFLQFSFEACGMCFDNAWPESSLMLLQILLSCS